MYSLLHPSSNYLLFHSIITKCENQVVASPGTSRETMLPYLTDRGTTIAAGGTGYETKQIHDISIDIILYFMYEKTCQTIMR